MGRMKSPEDEHTKTVTFRAAASKVEQLDEMYENRSEVFQEYLSLLVDASNEQLVTPSDKKLQTSYLSLVEVQNEDGIIPIEVAKSVIAQKTGLPKTVISRTIVRRLDEKDFVDVQHGAPGKGSNGVIRVREYYAGGNA